MGFTIVQEDLPNWQGEACLVKQDDGDRYFVVSSVVAMFSGFETLVFPATREGEVERFLEVAGGKGMSREQAIADLEEYAARGFRDPWDDDDDESDE